MTSLCILLTIGRLILRWRMMGKLKLDDILNAVAALLIIPYIAICLALLPWQYNIQLYVLGLDHAPSSAADAVWSAKMGFTMLLLFLLIMYIVKASFLALYWHLFEVSARFRQAWWVTAGYTAVSFLVTWILVLFHCGSPSKVLDPGKLPIPCGLASS